MNLSIKSIFVIILIISVEVIIAQGPGSPDNINSNFVSIPSPNAASLGEYGQVPVSYFNGLPNISIPLFSGEGIDIGLNYHASGMRPDEHPGWVGLGWNLNSSGAITRIVNGGVDEVYVDDFTNPGVLSYYDNPDLLDRSNWYSESNLNNYLSLTDQIWESGTTLEPIPYPDEFIFNFNGYSGSFYFNHKGKWVVKTNDNIQLKIEETLGNFTLTEEVPAGTIAFHSENRNIARIFKGFKITTPDGYQYSFGLTQNSIEFSSSDPEPRNYNSNFIATSWYLTKIETPNHRTINYTYTRDNKARFKQSVTTQLFSWQTSSQSESGGKNQLYSSQRIFPCYLDKITTDLVEIKFNKSVSNELNYNFDTGDGSYGGMQTWVDSDSYTHHIKNYAQTTNNWYKLDDFEVKDLHGILIKKVKFNYLENSSSRLFLTSIDEYDKNISQKKSYDFSYDNTPLPEYCSQKLDHWGFYNGENYFETNTPQDLIDGVYYFSETQAKSGDYYNSREPNLNFMKAGILKEIVYPTGGNTKFYYEPHSYSKIVEKSENGIFNLLSVSDKIAGGLRIKKIVSIPEGTHNDSIVKEYLYINDYKNNDLTSSGILSGIPRYLEEGPSYDGSVDYWYWNSYSIEPLSRTGGNHVTYSKVIEKTSGNGYVEYAYSNHNEINYRDQKANEYTYYAPNQWKYLAFNSYDLERGKLLWEKYYNENKDLQKEVIYNYTNVLDSDDNSIRALFTSYRQFGNPIKFGPYTNMGSVLFGNALSAIEIKKYYKYLSGKTEKIYENGNVTLNEHTNYLYNSKRLQKQVNFVSSNGKEFITKSIYADDIETRYKLVDNSDIVGGALDTDAFYAVERMQVDDLHQYSTPIQVETYYKEGGNEKLISLKRTDFEDKTNDIIVTKYLKNLKGEFNATTNPLNTKVIYHDYDDYGNPLEVSMADGSHTYYVWGYEHSQPIAKIENFSSISGSQQNLIDDVVNASNIDSINSTENTLRTKLQSLRQGFPESMVTTYTYDPLIGVTSITDASGYTNYYTYDDFNRLEFIKDKDEKILEQYRYNYALDELVVDINASTTSTTVGSSVNFTVNVTGGSGDFTYEWTVPGVSGLGNTSNINVTTLSSHTPNFTATCKVTDNQTLESVSVNKQVTVTQSYPVLSVNPISYTGNRYVGSSLNYSVSVSGGSGSYTYEWKKTNDQSTTVIGNNSSSISNQIGSQDCLEFTVTCKVTDNNTNEVITKTKIVPVLSGCSPGGKERI